jgi:hypothetical protein
VPQSPEPLPSVTAVPPLSSYHFLLLRFPTVRISCSWLQVVLPCHGRSTLGAFLLITGAPQFMGCSFTTVGTNAIAARACCKTTSLPLSTTSSALATAAFTHASSCSRALASRPCSVSSRHFAHLLWRWFNGRIPVGSCLITLCRISPISYHTCQKP